MSYEYNNNEFKDVLRFRPSVAASDEMLLSIQAGGAFRGIHIPKADVPTVALGLLKAAGHPVPAELREAADKAEAEAAEKKLQGRRDALAKEFTNGVCYYASTVFSTKAAIDRIIELEDGASRD